MPTRKKLLHVRSNRPLTGDATKPQLPESSFLDYGELAINYGEGIETLSIKNSGNDIVTFSSDIYNSNTYTTKEETIENELVVATALTEHEDRLDGLDETVAGKQDALTFDTTPTANSLNPVTSGGIKEYVDDTTDDTLVIECSGELIEDSQISYDFQEALTITNGITYDDVINAYESGKKIVVKHAISAQTLNPLIGDPVIIATITSFNVKNTNGNYIIFGRGVVTTDAVNLILNKKEILYTVIVTTDEENPSDNMLFVTGGSLNVPIAKIDTTNENAKLVLAGELIQGASFEPIFRYDSSDSTTASPTVAYLSDLESITSMTEITHSDLVTARNDNNLKPGTWYRITDYTTTTTQANTQSASHNFDVIVLATSSNTLSEEARAIKHAGDTYFVNSNLNAWKVWYCLDNNKTKYNWADTTNGKGVIYRLIDEWGNDCPYDFKSIQFKRKLYLNTIFQYYFYDETYGTDTWVYTFNAAYGETLSDNSLGLNLNILGGNGIVGLCFNNAILPCYDTGNYSNVIAGTAGEIILNDTVFLSTVPGNTNYLLGLATYDNSIDVNNRNNTLYGNNLTIGKGFEYNAFISISLFAQVDSGNSTFGNGCKHFNVTEPMDNCTFGNNVQYFSVTQTADGGYKNIIVENGVQYVTLDVSGSDRSIIQNITIAQGVAGDSNNTKVIYHNTVHDNFQTIYRSINSQVVTV